MCATDTVYMNNSFLLQDLGSKVNPNSKELTKRRDAFIVMLHHIQVSVHSLIAGGKFMEDNRL